MVFPYSEAMNPWIHRSGIPKLVIVSPKINSIGNFCWLGKSQFTLLIILINFISGAFHA